MLLTVMQIKMENFIVQIELWPWGTTMPLVILCLGYRNQDVLGSNHIDFRFDANISN